MEEADDEEEEDSEYLNNNNSNNNGDYSTFTPELAEALDDWVSKKRKSVFCFFFPPSLVFCIALCFTIAHALQVPEGGRERQKRAVGVIIGGLSAAAGLAGAVGGGVLVGDVICDREVSLLQQRLDNSLQQRDDRRKERDDCYVDRDRCHEERDYSRTERDSCYAQRDTCYEEQQVQLREQHRERGELSSELDELTKEYKDCQRNLHLRNQHHHQQPQSQQQHDGGRRRGYFRTPRSAPRRIVTCKEVLEICQRAGSYPGRDGGGVDPEAPDHRGELSGGDQRSSSAGQGGSK